jgi:hypothetical protein
MDGIDVHTDIDGIGLQPARLGRRHQAIPVCPSRMIESPAFRPPQNTRHGDGVALDDPVSALAATAAWQSRRPLQSPSHSPLETIASRRTGAASECEDETASRERANTNSVSEGVATRSSIVNCAQYSLYALCGILLDLMFPDSHDFPFQPTQTSEIAAVARPVQFDLRYPLFRQFSHPKWKPPAMPEIAVDENCYPDAPEHYIGTPWYVFGVALELQSQRDESLCNLALR